MIPCHPRSIRAKIWGKDPTIPQWRYDPDLQRYLFDRADMDQWLARREALREFTGKPYLRWVDASAHPGSGPLVAGTVPSRPETPLSYAEESVVEAKIVSDATQFERDMAIWIIRDLVDNAGLSERGAATRALAIILEARRQREEALS